MNNADMKQHLSQKLITVIREYIPVLGNNYSDQNLIYFQPN